MAPMDKILFSVSRKTNNIKPLLVAYYIYNPRKDNEIPEL